MLSLAWFVLRAAFWLGLLSLFVPGALPFQTITAGPAESVVERTTLDTLTSQDRAVAWRGPRPTNTNVRQARRTR
jgi:hypothetical protein